MSNKIMYEGTSYNILSAEKSGNQLVLHLQRVGTSVPTSSTTAEVSGLKAEEVPVEDKVGEVSYNTVSKYKDYVLSNTSINYLRGVHLALVSVIMTAISDSPYDFRITAGARTAKEQNALYQIGRTRKGTKVTNADGYKVKSNHQVKSDGYGYAVDIFCCGKYDENGKYIKYDTKEGYDIKKLKSIADHIKSVAKSKGVKVEWGGDWKNSWDSPHFELKL